MNTEHRRQFSTGDRAAGPDAAHAGRAAEDYTGRSVIDREGQKVGTIANVLVDTTTRRPEWGVVNTGFLGGKHALVPIADATWRGEELCVPFTKPQIKDAPPMDGDGEISVEREAALARHYGLSYSTSSSPTGVVGGAHPADAGTATQRGAIARDDAANAGDAMTRSEERLNVRTVSRPSELVRLRKTIVTEPVSATAQVRREEVRIEREPITDANRGDAMSGKELTESEHVVTLMREEPVVEKTVVPVERVRLTKETHVEEHEVTDHVRREEVHVERERDDRPR